MGGPEQLGSENRFLGKRLAGLSWKRGGKGEMGELLRVGRAWEEERSRGWVKPYELTLALDMVMMQTQTCDKPCSAHTLKSK